MLNFLTNKMKEMETEFDIQEHLVLDLGNAFTKVGFSGEDLPKLLMPSIFGNLQNEKLDKKSEISFEIK
jgi:actin-related protein